MLYSKSVLVLVTERRNNMKDSEVKKIITESVLGFLNEARRFPEPDNTPNKPKKPTGIHPNLDPDQEYLDKQYGGEGGGTHLSPWINKSAPEPEKKSFKPYIHPSLKKDFKPNPPSLNEEQLLEIEEIYKELTRK